MQKVSSLPAGRIASFWECFTGLPALQPAIENLDWLMCGILLIATGLDVACPSGETCSGNDAAVPAADDFAEGLACRGPDVQASYSVSGPPCMFAAVAAAAAAAGSSNRLAAPPHNSQPCPLPVAGAVRPCAPELSRLPAAAAWRSAEQQPTA